LYDMIKILRHRNSVQKKWQTMCYYRISVGIIEPDKKDFPSAILEILNSGQKGAIITCTLQNVFLAHE
ncbi:MAG: hypothetical protein ACWA6R_11775, partial [Nitrosomonas sp.]